MTNSNKYNQLDRKGRLPAADFEGLGLQKYVPIEWFKDAAVAALPAPDDRVFYSSGTGGEQSRVGFSKNGLELYQQSSVAHFRKILKKIFPTGGNISGFSLIPKTEEWPHSSLAQMMAWIAAEVDVTYVNTLDDLPCDQPIWIFGTVAHFLTAMRAKNNCPLHAKSFLFETGGSKNIGLEKSDFLELLKKTFCVDDANIFSEYGMSELSCQAYGPALGYWRFPEDVDCYIQTSDGSFRREGIGCLAVSDPLRVDCPFPIRSQDVVELKSGEIRYLYRLKGAPLKGCSTLVEGFEKSSPKHRIHSQTSKIEFNEEAKGRAAKLQTFFNEFFSNPENTSALAGEIESDHAAHKTLAELHSVIKKANWSDIVSAATQDSAVPREWLLILPNNHSLVGIYPLAVAYVLGLKVWIRLPEKMSGADTLISHYMQGMLQRLRFDLEIIAPTIKLGQSQLPPSIEGIICFGSDETINQIKDATTLPTVGFGNHISALYVDDINKHTAKFIVKEAFSLGQRGCLSTRILFTQTSVNETQIQLLREAFADFWRKDFCSDMQTSLQHQFINWNFLWDSKIQWHTQSPLFPIVSFKDDIFCEQNIAKSISNHPFVLPIVECVSPLTLRSAKKQLHALGIELFEVSEESLSHPGPSQPPWDGTLHGRALFVDTSL